MALSHPRRIPREHPPVGERLRQERQARGLSLRALAATLQVSPSLLSQIETGRARPSVSTLYALATELDISLDDLLFLDGERGGREDGAGPTASTAVDRSEPGGPVQRSSDRATIRLASGVVWERLTTASDPDVEFLHVTYEVGGASGGVGEYQRHGGHEWGYVLSGRLTVTIGFDRFVVGPGDAVSIPSTTPHRLANEGDRPVHAIWFVLGRHEVAETERVARRVALLRAARASDE